MSYIMVDIESDGPIPSDYSMICFGAVIVKGDLQETFYGQLCYISNNWIPENLAVSGFSRDQVLTFPEPRGVMLKFEKWLEVNSVGKPIFISDNNGFDWQFINWYFHYFIGRNPFGHSSMNLNSLYKGLRVDMRAHCRELCITKHTHNPVDDATGNAEALISMNDRYNLNLKLV